MWCDIMVIYLALSGRGSCFSLIIFFKLMSLAFIWITDRTNENVFVCNVGVLLANWCQIWSRLLWMNCSGALCFIQLCFIQQIKHKLKPIMKVYEIFLIYACCSLIFEVSTSCYEVLVLFEELIRPIRDCIYHVDPINQERSWHLEYLCVHI